MISRILLLSLFLKKYESDGYNEPKPDDITSRDVDVIRIAISNIPATGKPRLKAITAIPAA